MNIVVICYLYGSLLVYLVTGGADFGAGVVELFTPATDKKRVRGTMRKLTSPIWEADHMWLILAVVILFVGFPDIYAQISTTLFIPMTVLLFGIIGRGTSYAFRNGDPGHDRFKTADNFIYISSSIVAPFFLGIMAAAVFSGYTPGAHTVSAVYIFNWFNYSCVATGILTVMFCGYLAMIYTLSRFPAERQALKPQFLLLSFLFFAAALLVIFSPLFSMVLPGGIIVSITLVSLTAGTLYLMWLLVFSDHSKWARLFALLPVIFTILVLFGPHNINANSGTIHLPVNTNPDFRKTIDVLGFTLIIASFLIVPALGYLLYKFELPQRPEINESPE